MRYQYVLKQLSPPIPAAVTAGLVLPAPVLPLSESDRPSRADREPPRLSQTPGQSVILFLTLPSHRAAPAFFGNFYSIVSQTLEPGTYYTPVPLSLSTRYYASLESDGYTMTIQKQGVFLITYSITPSAVANANASVALLDPNGGSMPTVLMLSHRPMITNNNNVTAGFIASLPEGQQLFLGVWSNETVTLPENAKRWANVTISIVQVG